MATNFTSASFAVTCGCADAGTGPAAAAAGMCPVCALADVPATPSRQTAVSNVLATWRYLTVPLFPSASPRGAPGAAHATGRTCGVLRVWVRCGPGVHAARRGHGRNQGL
ncbi:hypothetical protein GCM10018787_02650 [Streptomyces thermodiastaticus]|nr:hypothetical protein GCM10018787_02650 [Streptomyces thermodiastaticus]